MATQLKSMTGEEFVKKILAGERDFSGIQLEEGFDLSGHDGFKQIQDYLKSQNLKENPIKITDSELMLVKAKGLYLPFVRGQKAKLNGAMLDGAILYEASLCRARLNRAMLDEAILIKARLNGASLDEASLDGASLDEAYLNGASLDEACLDKARLDGARLDGAYLDGASLYGASFIEADLRRVKGLEKALYLGQAVFNRTIVTKKEMEIIREALKERELFVLRDS